MVLINLLPWRVHAQQYMQRQRRWIAACAAASAVGLIILLHVVLQCWLDRVTQRLAELNASMTQLQQRMIVTNDPSLASMQNQLQLYQDGTGQLIRQLNEPHAAGVCFNKITRYRGAVRFHGYADSPQALSSFLTDWPAAAHFNEIRIESMKIDAVNQLAFAFNGVEKIRLNVSTGQRNRH